MSRRGRRYKNRKRKREARALEYRKLLWSMWGGMEFDISPYAAKDAPIRLMAAQYT